MLLLVSSSGNGIRRSGYVYYLCAATKGRKIRFWAAGVFVGEMAGGFVLVAVGCGVVVGTAVAVPVGGGRGLLQCLFKRGERDVTKTGQA